MQRSSVLLPAPLAPTSATISPPRTAILTSLSATSPSYPAWSPEISSTSYLAGGCPRPAGAAIQ